MTEQCSQGRPHCSEAGKWTSRPTLRRALHEVRGTLWMTFSHEYHALLPLSDGRRLDEDHGAQSAMTTDQEDHEIFDRPAISKWRRIDSLNYAFELKSIPTEILVRLTESRKPTGFNFRLSHLAFAPTQRQPHRSNANWDRANDSATDATRLSLAIKASSRVASND
jgi:hypothetical protein